MRGPQSREVAHGGHRTPRPSAAPGHPNFFLLPLKQEPSGKRMGRLLPVSPHFTPSHPSPNKGVCSWPTPSTKGAKPPDGPAHREGHQCQRLCGRGWLPSAPHGWGGVPGQGGGRARRHPSCPSPPRAALPPRRCPGCSQRTPAGFICPGKSHLSHNSARATREPDSPMARILLKPHLASEQLLNTVARLGSLSSAAGGCQRAAEPGVFHLTCPVDSGTCSPHSLSTSLGPSRPFSLSPGTLCKPVSNLHQMRVCPKVWEWPQTPNLSQLWVFSAPQLASQRRGTSPCCCLIRAAFQYHCEKTHPRFVFLTKWFPKQKQEPAQSQVEKMQGPICEPKRGCGGAPPAPACPATPPARVPRAPGAPCRPALPAATPRPGLHAGGQRAAGAGLRRAPRPRGAARSRAPRAPPPGSQHPLAPSTKAAGPALESLPAALPCAGHCRRRLLGRPGRGVRPDGPYQPGRRAGDSAAPAPGSRSSQKTRNTIQSIFHAQWSGEGAASKMCSNIFTLFFSFLAPDRKT